MVYYMLLTPWKRENNIALLASTMEPQRSRVRLGEVQKFKTARLSPAKSSSQFSRFQLSASPPGNAHVLAAHVKESFGSCALRGYFKFSMRAQDDSQFCVSLFFACEPSAGLAGLRPPGAEVPGLYVSATPLAPHSHPSPSPSQNIRANSGKALSN